MIVFKDGEKGYLDWLEAHPQGYVLNAKRNPTPTDLMLHIGKCAHLGTFSNPPMKMTSVKIKICSPDRADIQRWLDTHFPKGSDVKICRDCKPI